MMMQMIMMVMDNWCCGILVEVLINSSLECFQDWTVDQVGGGGGWGGGGGGRSFHSLAVLGKNECLCASILEYGMENRFRKVGLIKSGNLILTRPWLIL